MNRNIGIHDIYAIANERGVPAAMVACEYGRHEMLVNHNMWFDPISDEAKDEYYPDIDLVSGATDLLSNYAKSISTSIKFPVNTAYLHGLAVVSSAMIRSFEYNYYGGESPVNLYVVTSQPPSTGKSGINKALSMPVRLAYVELNKKHAKIRGDANLTLDKLNKELESAKVDKQIDQLTADINEQLKIIDEHPLYRYSLDDATPEALESIAFEQCGMFNVISDEADAINVLLGNVYGDGKANFGIFLKGWDGDWHSPARVTRKTKEGKVYGCLAVIAQDESINAILTAGQSGRGISERILIMRERNLFGTRDHSVYVPVCSQLRADYERMIYNMVTEEKTLLSMEPDAIKYLQLYRTEMEHKLADGAEYSNTMLRGAVGKADKQIIKLACVMHGIENWKPGGARSKTIGMNTVVAASYIYNQLCKTYISAADSQGYMGTNVELGKLKEYLAERLSKGRKSISISQLRDNVKRLPQFKGVSNLTSKLREELLPSLVEDGYCVVSKNDIWINPKLK